MDAEPDWEAIRMDYLANNMQAPELAAKYKVKIPTIRKRIERGRWSVERIKFQQEAMAKARERATDERAAELLAFNSDDLKVARAIRARVARRLSVTDKEIPPSELRQIASAAEAAQRIGRLALGVSTENLARKDAEGDGPTPFAPDLSDRTNDELDAIERAALLLTGGSAGDADGTPVADTRERQS